MNSLDGVDVTLNSFIQSQNGAKQDLVKFAFFYQFLFSLFSKLLYSPIFANTTVVLQNSMDLASRVDMKKIETLA